CQAQRLERGTRRLLQGSRRPCPRADDRAAMNRCAALRWKLRLARRAAAWETRLRSGTDNPGAIDAECSDQIRPRCVSRSKSRLTPVRADLRCPPFRGNPGRRFRLLESGRLARRSARISETDGVADRYFQSPGA